MDKNESGKNRIIEKWLKELPEDWTILDAGAGELKWKPTCSHLRYVSQDFCQYDGMGDGKGIQTGEWDTKGIDLISDITSIPVEDNSFDAILCSEVFEHIPYPEAAVREFSRIVRPGGTLILSAPFCSLTHFAPYHFCTGFNIFWYERVLNDYGFDITEYHANGDYFSYMEQEIQRLNTVYVKYFGKESHLLSFTVRLLLKILRKKCVYENKSSELGCFGYCVKAMKR